MIRRHPVAALAAASGCYAAMALWTRLAGGLGYSSAELVLLRMGIAGLFCLALFASGAARFRLRRPGLLFARGLLGSAAILLFFYALCHLPVGEATLLNFTSPLFTTLFAAIFLGERPGPRPLVALAVTLGGLALTIDAGSSASLSFGLCAGLGSAVLSGAAVTTVRALRRTEGPTAILFSFACIACVVSAPLSLPSARLPRTVDLPILLAIGLSSIAAQLLSSEAMGYVSAVTAAVVGPLTPLLAFALGALFLGEPWTARVALGSLVALGGVVLGSTSSAATGSGAPVVE